MLNRLQTLDCPAHETVTSRRSAMPAAIVGSQPVAQQRLRARHNDGFRAALRPGIGQVDGEEGSL
jgi:hypothetical protein